MRINKVDFPLEFRDELMSYLNDFPSIEGDYNFKNINDIFYFEGGKLKKISNIDKDELLIYRHEISKKRELLPNLCLFKETHVSLYTPYGYDEICGLEFNIMPSSKILSLRSPKLYGPTDAPVIEKNIKSNPITELGDFSLGVEGVVEYLGSNFPNLKNHTDLVECFDKLERNEFNDYIEYLLYANNSSKRIKLPESLRQYDLFE
jgi:hypothetical protein